MTAAHLYEEFSTLFQELKKELAQLKATHAPEKKELQLGLLKGKIIIHKSFDDPIPGFEEYM